MDFSCWMRLADNWEVSATCPFRHPFPALCSLLDGHPIGEYAISASLLSYMFSAPTFHTCNYQMCVIQHSSNINSHSKLLQCVWRMKSKSISIVAYFFLSTNSDRHYANSSQISSSSSSLRYKPTDQEQEV